MRTAKKKRRPASLPEPIDPNLQSGSLNERLAAYRKHSERQHPGLARAYDRLVKRLADIVRGSIGPAVGERMPDFTMPDQSGTLVSLASLLRRGPLLISFNRGHWCPYCRIDLRALAATLPDIQRQGGQIVSIMPDTASFTGAMQRSEALPFPVLSDIDLGYTLALGLVYWVGTEVVDLYKELGIELERYQGGGSQFLPLTAKFVVGPDGRVSARHVDIEFRDRVEVSRSASLWTMPPRK